MALDNDTRGWIMSGVSGIACIIGSAIICLDIIVQTLTRYRNFQIVKNNAFLSASLCLSSGVLLFTSLYSMLPISKKYLTRVGYSPPTAAYILIGLFLSGVVGITVFSEFIHRHIPSHVVDCTHTHTNHTRKQDADADPEIGEGSVQANSNNSHNNVVENAENESTERTPLLRPANPRLPRSAPAMAQWSTTGSEARQQRDSLRRRLSRQIGLLIGTVKDTCDDSGPCYGFSQACGQECSKVLPQSVHGLDGAVDSLSTPANHLGGRNDDNASDHMSNAARLRERLWYGDFPDEPDRHDRRHQVEQQQQAVDNDQRDVHAGFLDASSTDQEPSLHASSPRHLSPSRNQSSQHHHHVPQNAFLSIGLQTSLAIALHKLPEGFVTYATNHASPKLGMAVFLALFIHNITEGFAMALPLYLALNSRAKAIMWSFLLGGISQPAGAGIAALWIWGSHRAGGGDSTTGYSWGVYGGMFAVTAGIMTSVGLQLFSEGLELAHHRGMCIGFAIGGMGLMGLSFALTA